LQPFVIFFITAYSASLEMHNQTQAEFILAKNRNDFKLVSIKEIESGSGDREWDRTNEGRQAQD
jgi:hypothetical protein